MLSRRLLSVSMVSKRTLPALGPSNAQVRPRPARPRLRPPWASSHPPDLSLPPACSSADDRLLILSHQTFGPQEFDQAPSARAPIGSVGAGDAPL
jgi:hypothetical protein